MINGLAVPWGLMPLFIAKTLVNTALFVVPIVQGSDCQVFLQCFRQTDSPFWPERDLDEQAYVFKEEGSEAWFIELSLQMVLPNREDMGHSDRVHQRYEIVSTLFLFGS